MRFISHSSLLPEPINLMTLTPLLRDHLIDIHLHAANEPATQAFQPRHKNIQQTANDEMADTGADIQPGALVADHPEEIQRHDVAEGHDQHEQRRRLQAQSEIEDAEVGGEDGEGDQDLEEEERALGEGVEDRDEPVDGVEAEGGDGRDVAGGEEGGLEEVEEEEGDAHVGDG